MNPRPRSERLEEWALELGFHRAGVAELRPAETGEALRRWVAEGRHAGMAYMAERLDERCDPALVLPGARSAVCVALHYAGDEVVPGDLWPRVARYARGRDYHNLMGRRLRKLARRIEESFPGARARPYVDTGPVLERELGARAGLGAVGKNTMLLHPEHGSWFLLGEVLTTLELAPGARLADPCGSCSRCLDACPTGALDEPYRLDAERCISYWTIEHRGPIPSPRVEALEGWVFGCDVCQEVCPWNRAPAPGHPELDLAESRRSLGLAGLLGLDEPAYRETFRGSPMQRARRTGLRRNALAAIGASSDAAYRGPLEAVRSAAEGPDEAALAAWAEARLERSRRPVSG